MQKLHRFVTPRAIATAVVALAACIGVSAHAQTVIDDWANIKPPPAPQLKAVKVEPKTTALLVLDEVKGTCNNERRPRCLAAVPKVEKLLNDARAKGVAVVYSVTSATTQEDILPPVAPKSGEPVVKSGVDKFMGTDLDKILKDKGIQTVIIVGTTAEGAVLYTASGAALRGYNVVVPLEGSTAGSPYAEAVTAWMLANAPGVAAKTTLTKMDMITY